MSIFDSLYPEETATDDDEIMPARVRKAADMILGKAGHLLSDRTKEFLNLRSRTEMEEKFTHDDIAQVMNEIIDKAPLVMDKPPSPEFTAMTQGMKITPENQKIVDELDQAIADALEKVGPIRVYRALKDATDMFEEIFKANDMDEVVIR